MPASWAEARGSGQGFGERSASLADFPRDFCALGKTSDDLVGFFFFFKRCHGSGTVHVNSSVVSEFFVAVTIGTIIGARFLPKPT